MLVILLKNGSSIVKLRKSLSLISTLCINVKNTSSSFLFMPLSFSGHMLIYFGKLHVEIEQIKDSRRIFSVELSYHTKPIKEDAP